MPLTVRDVLAMPQVQHAAPRVVAGHDRLDGPVRWVHVAEIPDIAQLLQGGELVLTTGIGLPEADAELRRWVDALADVGVAGIVVELGRRFTAGLPKSLVARASRRGLPLVEVEREMRFVALTEAVHWAIVDEQMAVLRASDEIHRTFTELSVEGAEPQQVLRETARLAGHPVVLENLARQVLAVDADPGQAEDVLDRWETRSREVQTPARTHFDPASGWLVTTVEARGNAWGRLVLVCGSEPPPLATVLLERAASTIALNRLVALDRSSIERQAHSSLLSSILNHSASTRDVGVRAHALGVPLEKRRLLGVVVRPQRVGPGAGLTVHERRRALVESVDAAVRSAGLTAITGELDEPFGGGAVGLLVSLATADTDDDALAALSTAVHAGPSARGRATEGVVVAAGSVVGSLDGARRSLVEAAQVADAALHAAEDRRYYRLLDVRLRGLLHLLRDDARLQTFVERELGPLLSYDERHGTAHAGVLDAYLTAGRNKQRAAAAAGLSRSAFYERLQLIERVLGLDLGSSETCLSLHVALMARDVMRLDRSFTPG